MTKSTVVSEKAAIKSRARKYLARGEWKKALREFQHLVRSDPTDFRACLKVGDLLQKLGKSDEAVAQYKTLAHQYMAEGFFFKALSLSKIVRRIDPSQDDIQDALARICAEGDDAPPDGADRQLIRKRLREIPLFSDLKPAELRDMMDRLTIRRAAEGDFVCKEGDPGDSIFFVSAGEVEVLKYMKRNQQDAHLSRLSEGDFFGEFGFFSDRKRHASVRALTDLEVLEISKENLDTLTVSHPRMRNILLNFYKKRVIDTLLAFSPLFGCLPPDQRALLVSRFTLRRLGENRVIFEEGAPPTSFFVIKQGEVEVSTSEKDREKVTLAILKQGDFFGEISLILKQPRMASVRTTKATELLELKQADFEYIVSAYSPIKSALENLAQERLQSTRQILSSQWRHASGTDMV